jgi:archaellin
MVLFTHISQLYINRRFFIELLLNNNVHVWKFQIETKLWKDQIMGQSIKSINIIKHLKILLLISIITATAGCTALQNLQEQATNVASENIEDISSGLTIKSLEGIAGGDGKITQLYLRVTTQSGSQSINLSQVIIHMSDGKGIFDLLYTPDNSVKKGFSAKMLIDSGSIFSISKPLVDKGDLLTITIDTLQNGISLGSGDILSISFESAKGNKALPLVFELETIMKGVNKIY